MTAVTAGMGPKLTDRIPRWFREAPRWAQAVLVIALLLLVPVGILHGAQIVLETLTWIIGVVLVHWHAFLESLDKLRQVL